MGRQNLVSLDLKREVLSYFSFFLLVQTELIIDEFLERKESEAIMDD